MTPPLPFREVSLTKRCSQNVYRWQPVTGLSFMRRSFGVVRPSILRLYRPAGHHSQAHARWSWVGGWGSWTGSWARRRRGWRTRWLANFGRHKKRSTGCRCGSWCPPRHTGISWRARMPYTSKYNSTRGQMA